MNMHKLSKQAQSEWINGKLPLSVRVKNWIVNTLGQRGEP